MKTDNTVLDQNPKKAQWLEPYHFTPGASGNPSGRPKGSRSKLSESYTQALYEDFQEHGVSVIEKVRKERQEVYLTCISKLIPKDIKLEIPQLNKIVHVIVDTPHSINELDTQEIVDLLPLDSQPTESKVVTETIGGDETPTPTHETDGV